MFYFVPDEDVISLRPSRRGENAMPTREDHRFQFHEKYRKEAGEYNKELVKSTMKIRTPH